MMRTLYEFVSKNLLLLQLPESIILTSNPSLIPYYN